MAGDAAARVRAAAVRLLAFDVDGVLTDGRLWFGADGEALKAFHVADGIGLKMLSDAGIAVAIVSGRRSAAVEARARELGIAHLHQGVADKGAVVDSLTARLGLDGMACGFMGDDLPDLAAMRRCGFAATVPGAPAPLLSAAHYVCERPGGAGAVRELCEFVLACHGSLAAQIGRLSR